MDFRAYKELLHLSFPILLISLSNSIINLASIPILGYYGVVEMTATAVSASIIIVMTSVLLASLTGFRILGSKAYGAKNDIQISKYFFSNLTLCLFLAGFMVGLVHFLGQYIICLLYTSPSPRD